MTSIEHGIRDMLTKHPVLESEIVYYFSPRSNDFCHKLNAALATLFHKFARTTMKKSAKQFRAAQGWTTSSDEQEGDKDDQDDQSDEEQEGELDEDSYE